MRGVCSAECGAQSLFQFRRRVCGFDDGHVSSEQPLWVWAKEKRNQSEARLFLGGAARVLREKKSGELGAGAFHSLLLPQSGRPLVSFRLDLQRRLWLRSAIT